MGCVLASLARLSSSSEDALGSGMARGPQGWVLPTFPSSVDMAISTEEGMHMVSVPPAVSCGGWHQLNCFQKQTDGPWPFSFSFAPSHFSFAPVISFKTVS